MSGDDAGVSAELVVPEQPPPAPPSNAIEAFLADLSTAYQIAVRLVRTPFVPATYTGKPENAAAAIVTGAGLGLDPMASLRSIDIIQGVPALRAVALRAIVQAHGHELWVEESSSNRAVVAGRRRGSNVVQRSLWDTERARLMGLIAKDNWRRQPGAMLVARATSECARLIAADALLGVPYTTEEVLDAEPVDAPAAEAKPTTRTARRAPRTPVPAAEPADADPLQLTDDERAEYGIVPPHITGRIEGHEEDQP